MKDQLVKLISEHLHSVFETGQTFYYFKKSINPYLFDLGITLDNFPEEDDEESLDEETIYNKNLSTENLELIYHTYASFYYLTQRFSSMIENIDERPYWQYSFAANKNTSEFWDALNNKVFLNSDPFWDKFFPPNYPGCTAYVLALNEEEVKTRKLQVSDGETIIHPFPEWAFNPAKTNWHAFFDKFILKTFGLI